MSLRTSIILESRLDALATLESHGGFDQFGSAGGTEAFMDELSIITDRIMRLESVIGLSILQEVITDLLESQDE